MAGDATHRVVILGGGSAGLAVATALRRALVEVTAILPEEEEERAFREELRARRNARIFVGEVTDVDLRRRIVACRASGGAPPLAFDSLIVATGSAVAADVAAHAYGSRTTDDPLELRRRVLVAFELAELERDAACRAAWLTVVVVGAGPVGVETACRIAELSCSDLRSSFRSIDTSAARVVLVEGTSRFLPVADELPAR